MPRLLALLLASCVALPAAGEGAGDFFRDGDFDLALRYRFENVQQDGLPEDADASTLRIRLDLESGVVRGFSGFLELDHVEALGGESYNDTRNGKAQYPVVADPQGTGLNQGWLQFAGAKETRLRIGRQKIAFGNERFVGPVGWRQNEQSFDALRLDTQALPGAAIAYAYVDRVLRIYGPDAGAPPAELSGDCHLLDLRISSLPAGALAVYAQHLDFRNAPQLSSDTAGIRYDGEHALAGGTAIGWALEYAAQQEAGGNAADVDAHYLLAELRLKLPAVTVTLGQETLSGRRGAFAADANPAFQTPLATLHPFQGWADKFTTTPSAGVVDSYLGVSLSFSGWKAQAAWHDFGAEATGAGYGTELDLALSRKFAERYELLVKFADYSADGQFTDTRKLWVQLAAAF